MGTQTMKATWMHYISPTRSWSRSTRTTVMCSYSMKTNKYDMTLLCFVFITSFGVPFPLLAAFCKMRATSYRRRLRGRVNYLVNGLNNSKVALRDRDLAAIEQSAMLSRSQCAIEVRNAPAESSRNRLLQQQLLSLHINRVVVDMARRIAQKTTGQTTKRLMLEDRKKTFCLRGSFLLGWITIQFMLEYVLGYMVSVNAARLC
ncbi:hypothetical protein K470DRAFT_134458 [Piedraia hortae CBS 480.64]|uniref:Uncharacterized protein n=1 Tax=Piedraia hortae CBS 480.64 TaxID=1314780 RepID=A0A6A7BSL0_9PEZI|nr:hypothetical protein K470DRAFT_134458 [Piedraia hortae CBS 480.64]